MKKQKNSIPINMDDFIVVRPKLSQEKTDSACNRIKIIIPTFRLGEQALLSDLDEFLKQKYKAEKADWRDMDKCTHTKVKRYNKYCHTVFCISEGNVTDEDYYISYIIKRENCIKPSTNKDDFFYDGFLIIGSKDKVHFSSSYVGGYSEGLLEELYLLKGRR